MPIPTADHAKWMIIIFQTTAINQLVVSVLFRKYLLHQDPQIPKSKYYITLFSMWIFVVQELQQSSIFIRYGVLIFLKHSVYFSFLLFLIHFLFFEFMPKILWNKIKPKILVLGLLFRFYHFWFRPARLAVLYSAVVSNC